MPVLEVLPAPEPIDTQWLIINPTIGHSEGDMDDPGNILRRFDAQITDVDEGGETFHLGRISGWIGWDLELHHDIEDAGDHISGHAELLGGVVDDIRERHHEQCANAALLIEMIYLEPQYRGQRLAGGIIANLMHLLRLDPETTVVVMKPEPVTPDGRPFDDGPDRDMAMRKLKAAYKDSGLRAWRQGGTGVYTTVWWLPFPEIN